MLVLSFRGLWREQSRECAPAPWFRLAGNFIRRGPDADVVATFHNHHWSFEGNHFSAIQVRGEVCCRFEDTQGGKSEVFGPFPEFIIADGVVHASNKVFAKFIEETQLWHCFPLENYWPVLRLEPPA